MDEHKNWFDKFSSFMDQNIRGVQLGIYSVAGLGLVIALRSVRPFAKFRVPSDIPAHFIKKRMSFVGKVKMVAPSSGDGNPLLYVDHRPLINLMRKRDGELPIDISSINITGNGFVWLQSLLTNQDISFIPLRTSKDRVYCVVYRDKQNIGKQLVTIGFATVSPIDLDMEKNNYYLKYYKTLLAAEKKAERKGAGVWLDSHRALVLKNLLNKIKGILFSLKTEKTA